MRRILSFAALGALLVLVLSGCMFGLTLENRIQHFASDLNLADRSDIYLNFHPTETTDYDAIRDTDYFAISLPLCDVGDTPYVIVILDASNEAAVTATIDSTAIGASGPYDALFTMATDGMDYKIAKMQADFGSGMIWVVQ